MAKEKAKKRVRKPAYGVAEDLKKSEPSTTQAQEPVYTHNSFAVTMSPEAINDIATWLLAGDMKFVDLKTKGIVSREFLTLAEMDVVFAELLNVVTASRQAQIAKEMQATKFGMDKLRSQNALLKGIIKKNCPQQAIDDLVVCQW